MDLDPFNALINTATGREALAAAQRAVGDSDDPLEIATRLRRSFPAELAAAALTQARLRAKAVAKFGPAAALMYFTPAGLEQATRPTVSSHRAGRYVRAGATRVGDLGCGIGGDMIALASGGLGVLAVERDPLTAAVATTNAAALGLADQVEVRRADATTLDLAEEQVDAIFCDPARRTDRGRRIFDPESFEPPWSFVRELAAAIPATGIKIAPGIPHELIPADTEAEWISDRGEVKEAALWFGPLRTGAVRRATLLPSGASISSTFGAAGIGAAGTKTARAASIGADGEGTLPPVGPIGRFFYEPDGAVIRAHLVAETAAQIGAHLIDPRIAYLSSAALVRSPFVTGYRVREVMPFQLKRLRAALGAAGVGAVTIKKRGSAIDPEWLRRRLRLPGTGSESVVIFLTRIGDRPVVILADSLR